MNVVTKAEFLARRDEFLNLIRQGAVFIYPTDTIYGIGCDASNEASVMKIRFLKQRDKKPFSVAVPSKRWISDNCEVTSAAKEWLGKLPGPYTLLLRLKNKVVAPYVIPETDIIGIRIPNCWFSEIISELGLPIVSTSVNLSGRQHMSSLDTLEKSIGENVDFILYEGKKEGKPSTIVKLYSQPEIVER